MTPPTAERLRELRLHHTGCPDMCPDAELLAALDHALECAEDIAEYLRLGHAGTAMIEADELKAYLGGADGAR